jgi:hypothetical protein
VRFAAKWSSAQNAPSARAWLALADVRVVAAARCGKPRLPHVVKAIAEAHLGTHPTEEARRRMSEAQQRRGARPPKAGRPWTAEEGELMRSLPAREVAERTGRTLTAVYSRRDALGLPDGRSRAARGAAP